jgi:hypothetical protein
MLLKNYLRIVFLPCVFCFTLTGCKKHVTDYREQFLGYYSFTIHKQTLIINGTHYDTIYSPTGNINYGSRSNTIVISCSSNDVFEPFIYEDGTLYQCVCGSNGSIVGEFKSTQSLKFDCRYDGLASIVTFSVTGEKK